MWGVISFFQPTFKILLFAEDVETPQGDVGSVVI